MLIKKLTSMLNSLMYIVVRKTRIMNKLNCLLAAAVLSFGGAAAHAATFSLVGGSPLSFGTGNYDATCEGGNTTCYNPKGEAAALMEDLTVFDGSNPGPGLYVTGNKQIKVTFLGYEAGKLANTETLSISLSGTELFNKISVVGSSYSFQGSGVLDFGFRSKAAGGTLALNNGTFEGSAAIGFSKIYDGRTIYAFFDDAGAGDDRDFDDMVVKISAVPLPAGFALLGTAVAALGLRRRRQPA